MDMARKSGNKSSKTAKRPHPMPRKAGVGTGRGYKCGGKIKK